jgi:hypothetical protein
VLPQPPAGLLRRFPRPTLAPEATANPAEPDWTAIAIFLAEINNTLSLYEGNADGLAQWFAVTRLAVDKKE